MSLRAARGEKPFWRGALFELVFVVSLAVGLALGAQAVLAKPYRIPSESMLPTLEVGQRVVVDRVSYRFSDPGIGDIVVFKPPIGAQEGQPEKCAVKRSPREACGQALPGQASETFIKRIVAGPGDRLYISRGHPVVNGVRAREDFAVPCERVPVCNLTEEITIPDDHFFMMGDNRPHSLDSRFWGPVPRDSIIGRAVVTYWPPDRLGVF